MRFQNVTVTLLASAVSMLVVPAETEAQKATGATGAPAAQAGAKPAPPAAAPAEGAPVHTMVTPKELTWVDGPPGLPPGQKIAILAGDPGKPGPFTIRAKVPANYTIPAHWHPGVEHVTVLSGTVFMRMGDKLDAAAAKALPAGSFAVMPPKNNHFFFTKKAAEIQVHGVGPFAITYVNPADDPRAAAPKDAAQAPSPAKK